jgi:hypothetical protein
MICKVEHVKQTNDMQTTVRCKHAWSINITQFVLFFFFFWEEKHKGMKEN